MWEIEVSEWVSEWVSVHSRFFHVCVCRTSCLNFLWDRHHEDSYWVSFSHREMAANESLSVKPAGRTMCDDRDLTPPVKDRWPKHFEYKHLHTDQSYKMRWRACSVFSCFLSWSCSCIWCKGINSGVTRTRLSTHLYVFDFASPREFFIRSWHCLPFWERNFFQLNTWIWERSEVHMWTRNMATLPVGMVRLPCLWPFGNLDPEPWQGSPKVFRAKSTDSTLLFEICHNLVCSCVFQKWAHVLAKLVAISVTALRVCGGYHVPQVDLRGT